MDSGKAVDFLERIKEFCLDDRLFLLIILIVCFLGINMLIATFKGRDPLHIMIFDRIIKSFNDAFSYLIEETTGHIVQKMNALLALSLFLLVLGFIGNFFYKLFTLKLFDSQILVCTCCSIFTLGCSIKICSSFTRPRY